MQPYGANVPALPNDAPCATPDGSNSVTRCPSRISQPALASPMKPAPTMPISAINALPAMCLRRLLP
jgi:hypothetical protein